MPEGLVVAAIVATLGAAGVLGAVLWQISPPGRRGVVAALVLVELPLCFLALHFVRPVWEGWVQGAVGPAWFKWARSLSAPLTEELAKAWPLVIVWRLGYLRDTPPVALGMALGLGFGLGEVWTVAHLLSPSASVAVAHWYELGGFIQERVCVCMAHGAFTSMLVVGAARGRPGAGLAAAMGAHFVGNFPIYLALRFLSQRVGVIALQVWTIAFFAAMAALLVRLHTGAWAFGAALFGAVDCPRCHERYPRPFLALNFGAVRYERCAHCRTWNWT